MIGSRIISGLPPGFRFHPTDEELIIYYLRNQASSTPCPVSIIPEVNIYKFDPWQLPEKAEFGEKEWYFYTPRDRKYPNGVRPNRAAVSGYWKATGTDKAIHSGPKYVGLKKALVFYKGRPPKGIKTDWIMHEYRLNPSKSQPYKQNGSMRLDDWVLCRIYKKKKVARSFDHPEMADSFDQISQSTVLHHHQNQEEEEEEAAAASYKFPRTYSLAHLWELDCMGPSISHLMNDMKNDNATFNNNQEHLHNNGGFSRAHDLGQGHQSSDSTKPHVDQTTVNYEFIQ